MVRGARFEANTCSGNGVEKEVAAVAVTGAAAGLALRWLGLGAGLEGVAADGLEAVLGAASAYKGLGGWGAGEADLEGEGDDFREPSSTMAM